jgi:asparagine synthase (glutamine-hydrolysing)
MPARDVLREILRKDLFETGLPHLLRYEDRNSMAFSIESRVPFLTPKLAEFVFSLPEEFIIAPNGTSKAVFRAAMRGIVPDAILQRRDKIGFATPEKAWLQALRPWVESKLQSEHACRIPALRSRELLRHWERSVGGGKSIDSHLWRAINLIEWSRQFGVCFD